MKSLKFLAIAIIAVASSWIGSVGASAATAKPEQPAKHDAAKVVARSSSTKPGSTTTAIAGMSLPAGASYASPKTFGTDDKVDGDIVSYMDGTTRKLSYNGRSYTYDTTTSTYVEILTAAEQETRSPHTIVITEWNGTKGKFTENIPLPWPYSGPPTPVDHTIQKIE